MLRTPQATWQTDGAPSSWLLPPDPTLAAAARWGVWGPGFGNFLSVHLPSLCFLNNKISTPARSPQLHNRLSYGNCPPARSQCLGLPWLLFSDHAHAKGSLQLLSRNLRHSRSALRATAKDGTVRLPRTRNVCLAHGTSNGNRSSPLGESGCWPHEHVEQQQLPRVVRLAPDHIPMSGGHWAASRDAFGCQLRLAVGCWYPPSGSGARDNAQ